MNTTSNMKFSVQNTVGLPPHHLFILRSHLFFHSNNISLLTYFEFIVNKNSQIFSQELLSSPDFLPPFLFIFGERFNHLLYIRAYMLSHFSCVQLFCDPILSGEYSWECKKIKPVNAKGNQLNIHWKDWCWSWSSNTLATWCEDLTQ